MAFFAAAVVISAREPDGRVAFRYVWLTSGEGTDSRVLRLIVTPVVPMDDAELGAVFPASSSVTIHAAVLSGTPVAGAWPPAGLFLGSLHAGQPVILDLDVAAPRVAGGTLAFTLTARAGTTPVREGLGVTVGRPGPPGVLRGDVLEYPAEPGGQAP